MIFELIPKTKATLVDIDIQSLKMGQTDVKPAVSLHFKSTMPNYKLDMLDKTLRPFLYQHNPSAQQQGALEGIPVVSDMAELTPAATKVGPIHWDEEQTGSTLMIYMGVTGAADIKLKDGTLQKIKVDCKEGGAVDFHYRFYTADVDAETLGDLAVLKSMDMDIELTPPEVLQTGKKPQREIDESDEPGADTPEAALTRAAGGASAAPSKPVPKAVPVKRAAAPKGKVHQVRGKKKA